MNDLILQFIQDKKFNAAIVLFADSYNVPPQDLKNFIDLILEANNETKNPKGQGTKT